MQVLQRITMTDKSLLVLLMIIQPYCIQTLDTITDQADSANDSMPLTLMVNSLVIQSPKDNYTVGNTKCRYDNICGYHQGSEYRWCYTDKNWDYCCSKDCHGTQDSETMSCWSGTYLLSCGYGSDRSITGQLCHEKYPCGTHGTEDTDFSRYWCSYDQFETSWEVCCTPLDTCKDRGDNYGYWCYVGIIMKTRWSYCTP